MLKQKIINGESTYDIVIDMAEEEGKNKDTVGEVAEKTGEVVGKGLKTGVRVAKRLGKGLIEGFEGKKEEGK
jgi:hypothetical protein